jgi:uncharacterized coiled-coil protein SlyX
VDDGLAKVPSAHTRPGVRIDRIGEILGDQEKAIVNLRETVATLQNTIAIFDARLIALEEKKKKWLS